MTSWWTHIIQCTKYWVEIQTHSWRMCRRCTSFINKFTFDTNLNMETSSAGESLQSSLGFALITSPSQQVFLYKYVWYLNWLSVFWTRPLISLTVSLCISVAASVCAKPSLWKFPSFTYRAPRADSGASLSWRADDWQLRLLPLVRPLGPLRRRLLEVTQNLTSPAVSCPNFHHSSKKKKKNRGRKILQIKEMTSGRFRAAGSFFFSFYETETSIRCAAEPDVACVITGQRRREVNEGESTATCGGRRRCGWPSGGVSNDHMHIGCVSECGRQI